MSNCPVYVNQSYDPKRIDALYQSVIAKSHSDKPQYYSIYVDDIPVVEKSTNPELFFDYSEFINENTKQIIIFLYQSFQCRAANKYFFNVNGYTEKPNALNGIDPEKPTHDPESEQTIKERWRKDLHYEDLLEENELLREEIQELNTALELAETAKENVKQNRDLEFSGMVGLALNGLLNTDYVKKKLFFLDGLSGSKVSSQPNEQQTQYAGSFKRKSSLPNEPVDVEMEEVKEEMAGLELSEQEQVYLQTLMEVKQRVGQAHVKNVFHLLDLVTENPQCLNLAIKQVSNFLIQAKNSNQRQQVPTTSTTTTNTASQNTPSASTLPDFQNNDYSTTLKNAGLESFDDTTN